MDAKILHELFEYRDGELYRKIASSNRVKIGDKVGCPNERGYLLASVNNRLQKVHRIIFMMFNGYLPKEIDHIDGNKANNKIENLRDATRSENLRNTKRPITNVSGIKGIHWDKDRKKWQAQIQINRINKHLGRYDSLQEAKEVVEKARILYHGSYANHG